MLTMEKLRIARKKTTVEKVEAAIMLMFWIMLSLTIGLGYALLIYVTYCLVIHKISSRKARNIGIFETMDIIEERYNYVMRHHPYNKKH